ncbi:MAG: hypothetical protein KAS23_15690, partial [Anaerohalosphaera sp.]|nr:hypothetical protein [Anaerohalosphaera sp.]
YNISPKVRLKASANAPETKAAILNENVGLVCRLAGLDEFVAGAGVEKPKNAAGAIVDEMQVYLHDAIDPAAERKRIEKQKQQIENGLKGIQAKLGNENFISRAKPEVVDQARAKLAELSEQMAAIEKHLSELED